MVYVAVLLSRTATMFLSSTEMHNFSFHPGEAYALLILKTENLSVTLQHVQYTVIEIRNNDRG